VGMGRMADPSAIASAILSLLESAGTRPPSGDHDDLKKMRLVVTAGPTIEDIDPVRFISNRSTGKMGFAIAERAAARGAEVTLIAGPVSLATPAGVSRIDVRGALSMREALWTAMGKDLSRADALVMAAAVADHRPAEPSATKVKKVGSADAHSAPGRSTMKLIENPDLLAEIGAGRSRRTHPVLVGFAVETAGGRELVAYARRKLAEKRVDLVVANEARSSFGRDDNRATLVTKKSADALPAMSKVALADVLLDRVRRLLWT
ncbi:MAG: phosphopantothenoylcysteine decarboxylase, partial [Polyangiaceae bacterium]